MIGRVLFSRRLVSHRDTADRALRPACDRADTRADRHILTGASL